MMKHAILILAALVFAACSQPDTEPPVPHRSAVQLLRQQRGGLDDWQALQLAIAITESRCNPDALGAARDAGIFQITPVYVREVNRIAGTDFAPEDAFDIDASLELFALMQAHYNPERDIDTALRYHNRGPGYRAAVLANLDLVRRYETIRRQLTK